MEMFYLIIKIGMALVVMPDKYSKDQCELSGKANDSSLNGNYHYCVPAPNSMCKMAVTPGASFVVDVPCGVATGSVK